MVTSFTETEKQMVSVERAVQYIEDIQPEVSPRGSVSIYLPVHQTLLNVKNGRKSHLLERQKKTHCKQPINVKPQECGEDQREQLKRNRVKFPTSQSN